MIRVLIYFHSVKYGLSGSFRTVILHNLYWRYTSSVNSFQLSQLRPLPNSCPTLAYSLAWGRVRNRGLDTMQAVLSNN